MPDRKVKDSSDKFVFADSNGEKSKDKTSDVDRWKVIVSDDESEIHHVTQMVLQDFKFKGKKLELISAFSGEETIELVKKNPDTAILLLDVVMEKDDTGFEVVRIIRDVLKNDIIQIVLRTGQASTEPEKYIVEKYEINDYKTKTELTTFRLYTTMMSLLRAYELASSYQRLNVKLEKANEELEATNEEMEAANIELINSQSQLKISEEKYSALVNLLPDAVLQLDLDFRIVFANETAATLFSVKKRKDLWGIKFCDLVAKDQKKKCEMQKKILLDQKYSENFEYTVGRSPGNIFDAETSAILISDNKGEPASFIYTIRDISERKKQQNLLDRYQRQLETLLDEIPVPVVIANGSQELQYMNNSFHAVFGYDFDEIWTRALWFEKAYPDESNRSEMVEKWEKTLASLSPSNPRSEPVEFSITAKDGTLLITDATIVQLEDRYIISFVDVTYRKAKEERITSTLIEKEEMLREVHHRTKENLQVILSLIVLQAMNTDSNDVRSAMTKAESRIRSIFTVHEFLSSADNVHEIFFKVFAQMIIKQAAIFHNIDTTKINSKIESEALLISREEALFLGIILFELISNAFIHAYKGNEPIGVICSFSSIKDTHRMLKVSDKGSGLSKSVDINTAKTMGFMLVRSLVDQIRGKLETHIDKGTEISITYAYREHFH